MAPVGSRNRPLLTMESYVVRIYRRDDADSDAVAGMAEDALSGRKKAFQSLAELSTWLRHPPPTARRKTARTAPGQGDAQP